MKATKVKAVETVEVKKCAVCGKPTGLPYARTQTYGVLCGRLCDAVFEKEKRYGYNPEQKPPD